MDSSPRPVRAVPEWTTFANCPLTFMKLASELMPWVNSVLTVAASQCGGAVAEPRPQARNAMGRPTFQAK